MIKPAIVAVGYNRPDSMRRLLKSIAAAKYPFDDITLIISIDQCSKSDEVEKAAREVPWTHGERIIRRFKIRQGLRKHVLQCGDYSEQYGAVIVLEDDLVVSPSFYQYTYEAANYYCESGKVAGIGLYSHAWNGYAQKQYLPVKSKSDVYFGQFSITWGQCWIDKQWKQFRSWYSAVEDKLIIDHDNLPAVLSLWGEQSWGKYFVSYIVEKDLYYVIPYVSMSTNFSEVGQHAGKTDAAHQVCLLEEFKFDFRFVRFEDGIKYDVFFERIFEKDYINGISCKDICVDLNGCRTSTLGKEYLLTTRELPMNRIKTYALTMRPAESNVTFNVSGKGINLYKTNGETNLVLKPMTRSLREYESYGYTWKTLLACGRDRFLDAIKAKARRVFRI